MSPARPSRPPPPPSATDPGRARTRGRGGGPHREVSTASPSLSGPGRRPWRLWARCGAEGGSGRGAQAGGDEGGPGRHPDGKASPPAPPSPQQRPRGRGRAPEQARVQARSWRALASHARSAPPAAGRGRGRGRVRSRLGGRRPAPPRLLGNAHASFPTPLPYTPGWDSSDDDAHSYLQQTRTPPDREGGEAQRRPLAPSTGEVSQFSCPRGPGSEDGTG